MGNKKLKNKILILGLVLYLAAVLLAASGAFAQQGQKLELKIPQPGGQVLEKATLSKYISGIFTFGLMVVGITALASIMYGGIRYMASDLITTKQDAKDQITSAIYGLLLLLFSYLILNTINPELVGLRTAEMEPLQTTRTRTTTTTTTTNVTAPDNKFDYNPGIANQMTDASPHLIQFLDCMSANVPGNVGRISSISDSAGIQVCSANYSKPPCAHSNNSCHYGGTNPNCKGKSFAVDFGDEQNYAILQEAAKKCKSQAYVLNEGNHVHISIGAAHGCGCN
jgi:hypothetical protein